MSRSSSPSRRASSSGEHRARFSGSSTDHVASLTKEEKTYIREVDEQRARIDQYIADGKDEWHVNKQVSHGLCSTRSIRSEAHPATHFQKEVLQDCLQMVPDCHKRLATAVQDIKSLLVS